MAVTPFEFPPLFRKPKNVEIPKSLGVRTVVVDSSNKFLLTLQDILNPDLSLMFEKMHVIKFYSRFSRFLLLRQDYNYAFMGAALTVSEKSKNSPIGSVFSSDKLGTSSTQV